MLSRHALLDELPDSPSNLLTVIIDQDIRQAHRMALLATVDRPDETAVAGIELVDAGLLLDHLGAVQSQARLPRHDDVARKSSSERHSAETPDSTGHHTDDRGVAPQAQDGCHDFRNGREAEVGFLQAYAACLEQHHGGGRYSLLAVGTGEVEGRSQLRAGNLAQAAALKRPFQRHYHDGTSGYLSFHHNTTVVRLWGHSLQRQPWRLDAIEGAEQLSRSPRIEQCAGPLARMQFDEAAPVDASNVVSCSAHDSLASTACSRRN